MWPLSCFHFFLGKESNRQTREKKQKAPSFGGKCRFRLVVFPFVGFIKPSSEYENLTPFFFSLSRKVTVRVLLKFKFCRKQDDSYLSGMFMKQFIFFSFELLRVQNRALLN